MKSVAATGIKTPTFEAKDVMTLKEFLERSSHGTELYAALCLLHDMGRQMQALLSGGHGIACFSVDDVVIITHRESDAFTHSDPESTLGGADPQFLFLNDHLMFEVDDDGALIIDHALPVPSKAKAKYAFMSPELRHLVKAPAPLSVHFKTIYYSAAQLIIYFLLNAVVLDPLNPGNVEVLNPIKSTKLYWFLLRCLNPVPDQRKYIYL